MIIQFLINGLIQGLLYAVVAMAFALTYNTTRIFHIAYAGVLVVASYLLMLFLQIGVPAPISIALSILFCGLLNVGVEKVVYLPMEKRGNSHNTVMVASIGLFVVLTNLVALLFGNENKTISNAVVQGMRIGEYIITRMQIWHFGVAGLLSAVLLFVLWRTSLGIKIKALSADSQLFAAMGHNAERLRLLLFFISGGLAAVVSILLAYDVGFDPYFGMPLLLNALVAMIIGGLGNFKGVLLGGILLGVVQSLAVYFLEARWESAITFVVFLLVIIAKPKGLLGNLIREV